MSALVGHRSSADAEFVLFRTDANAPQAPSTAYGAASTLVHLAAAVGIADGGVSSPEVNQLGEHLRSSLGLSPAEMGRLYAHFLWLSTINIKLSGLQTRLASMTQEQRQRIGEAMVSVAMADGVVSPAEITMLGKIYRLLGLNPADVTSHVHASMTGESTPAGGPAGRCPARRHPRTGLSDSAATARSETWGRHPAGRAALRARYRGNRAQAG